MLSTDKEHIAFLTQYLKEHSINQVVISPGSRNAPIVTAFCAHPGIETFTIHDERAAAFTALGMAEASGKPVVLTCTSGSALLNYSPAIVEAYYRQIPLLILSADRPAHLIDQGDGQTIRQNGVFNNFILFQTSLPEEQDEQLLDKTESVLKKALRFLMVEPKGPVHINVPLSEPLYGRDALPQMEIECHNFHPEDDNLNFSEILDDWNSAKKKMIIVGQSEHNPALLEELRRIGEQADTAVLVENTSNLNHFPKFVHCIDRTLAAITDDEQEAFFPDLLISIGGGIVSKRIKAFLRKAKVEKIFRLGHYTISENTFLGNPRHLKLNPIRFLSQLNASNLLAESNFGSLWKQKDFLAENEHERFIASAPYSDLVVFKTILDSIPDGAHIHMGNSSVVRYCQLSNPIPTMKYYGNRGVSGIDGSASTAAGHAMVKPNDLHVMISGDTSFFYDSNAFWNEYLKDNLRVIVINNGGGGIFQIIDGPKSSEFSEQFFAPFEANIAGIANAYNCDYNSVSSLEELINAFEPFFTIDDTKRPKILEVKTNEVENGEILMRYFNHIKSAF